MYRQVFIFNLIKLFKVQQTFDCLRKFSTTVLAWKIQEKINNFSYVRPERLKIFFKITKIMVENKKPYLRLFFQMPFILY